VAKGPPPAYTRRDCRFDGVLAAALATVGAGQPVDYGGIEDLDRAAWPYNPRQPKTPADIAAWAALGLDEHGRQIR
jgi:hypothetical protein